MQIDEYCRHVESYLCRKNHGHLIRVAGPSFDLVSGWAERGIPLRVTCSGIDRCVERFERKGPRRRPIKIDFCEADVLDAFDEWRRAVGVPVAAADEPGTADQASADQAGRGRSLPAHLERVVLRLSEARASGRLDETFDEVIDSIARELDRARTAGNGLRGEARQQVIDRLSNLDTELLRRARVLLDDRVRAELVGTAEEELAGFRARMQPGAFDRAREVAFDRLLRERAGLPVVAFRS